MLDTCRLLKLKVINKTKPIITERIKITNIFILIVLPLIDLKLSNFNLNSHLWVDQIFPLIKIGRFFEEGD